MDYFRSIVVVAAIAGIVAGIGMTIAQQLVTVPMILKAELFEAQSASDGSSPATAAGVAAHDHGAQSEAHGHAEQAGAHDHGDGWAPADGIERTAFTLLANVVTGVGFALLLVAASELFGGLAGWRQGVFWGLAGFVIFTLAPGLGLAPELPAMPAAELGARQIWWVGTVVSTALALWLLFYVKSLPATVLAFVLLIAPHVIGAPQPASHESPIPDNLHHSFIVAVVLTTLVFWGLLGGLAGYARERFIGHA
ncbi:CbtA family protein [Methyloceanibacter sp.]|uniref:CbtA family protein n=1 Tax=Methyloceanibacter sp. TaxID=1965321 RepID=UPI002C6A0DED|nr:CbtA family protein [Methyloceanibacter sp.]HML91520.1 CbtA family protein [Methyloceanibacter sp.]